jgi:RimJ/RimL family protein N-acetyltransferase
MGLTVMEVPRQHGLMAELAPDLPVLAMGRTLLRPHRPADFHVYRRWLEDQEVNSLTMADPTYASLVAERTLSWMSRPDAISYALCVRPQGKLIGMASLTDLEPRLGSAEFRIRIGEPEYWGRGHGTEATILLCGYGLQELGLRRINLSVFDFNERAMRCYRRVGFEETGRRPRSVWRDGRLHDEVIMSLTRAPDRTSRRAQPHT